MVDRGNTDKHRTGITGNGLKGLGKVVETEEWGINTARERYGKMDASPPPPPDKSKPQFRTDQSMGSRGHIPASWVTGKGGDGCPPNFDYQKKRK